MVNKTMRATNSQMSETISNITKQSKFGTVIYTKALLEQYKIESTCISLLRNITIWSIVQQVTGYCNLL